MQSSILIVAFLASTLTFAALAQEMDEAATRNGYQRLPPISAKKGEPNSVSPAPIYAKIVEPRQKILMLDTGANKREQGTSHSIVGFEIDCAKGALRYRSAQVIDPPWNPKGTSVPVFGPWITPGKDSAPERALSFACKT